mgnify:CR=1 FL=1
MEQIKSACLLGDVLPTPFLREVEHENGKTIFRGGTLYRHPGIPPMLELEGWTQGRLLDEMVFADAWGAKT